MKNQKIEIKWNSKISGIYAWENKINGKMYIGKANNLYRRIYEEMNGFKNGKHQNLKKLFNAIQKYGINNFQVIKLLESPKEYLNKIEKLLIEYYDTKNNGYNCTAGGEGTNGHIVTKNQIEKQKEKLKIYWTEERKNEWSKKMKMWFNSKSESEQDKIIAGNLWWLNKEYKEKHKKNTNRSMTTDRIEAQRCSIKKYYKTHKNKRTISILMADPQGNEINVIGIDKFCKNNNFGYKSIKELINGQKTDHKGWKIIKKDI